MSRDIAIFCQSDGEPVEVNIYGGVKETALGRDMATVQVKLWSVADGVAASVMFPDCNRGT